MPNLTAAEVAYAAYGQTTGGLNYQGLPMPAWEQLPERIQQAWDAAATAVQLGNRPAVDIYPVGLLHDLTQWANNSDRRDAWRRLRYDLGRPATNARRRNWRGLRSYLNGYLAEPREWPDGLTRCGTGWTRGRALRDLQQRTAAVGGAA